VKSKEGKTQLQAVNEWPEIRSTMIPPRTREEVSATRNTFLSAMKAQRSLLRALQMCRAFYP
jgi:hypothetical protein